jgi:hypothetical protein
MSIPEKRPKNPAGTIHWESRAPKKMGVSRSALITLALGCSTTNKTNMIKEGGSKITAKAPIAKSGPKKSEQLKGLEQIVRPAAPPIVPIAKMSPKITPTITSVKAGFGLKPSPFKPKLEKNTLRAQKNRVIKRMVAAPPRPIPTRPANSWRAIRALRTLHSKASSAPTSAVRVAPAAFEHHQNARGSEKLTDPRRRLHKQSSSQKRNF